jgi:hypothetical protein
VVHAKHGSDALRSLCWRWGKVLLCFVLLDVLLFRVGLLWKVKPDFGAGTLALDWRLLYQTAERFETFSSASRPAVIVGSSVVFRGVDELGVSAALAHQKVPVQLLRLPALGADCTDTTLIVWNAMRLRPWLVVYGAASRDFCLLPIENDPVVRVFYDSSLELSALPRVGAEAQLEATVKRYWKLYRYRFFVRSALTTLLSKAVSTVALAGEAGAVASEGEGLPADAQRRFGALNITVESYRLWQRWYQSRRADDYLSWIRSRSSELLRIYAGQTLANCGPEANRHVRSFERMLGFLQRAHVRTVVAYFPENPVFREPEAGKYFDPALSDGYAGLFARQAVAHGARFVDLRNLLPAEDFYDLVHVNFEGMRKLSARMAEIVGEEWRAREGQAGQ